MRTLRPATRPSLRAFAALLPAICAAIPGVAHAQARGFHLDRLEVFGAPDDGVGVARAVVQPRASMFAQVGLGFSYAPLRTRTITVSSRALAQRNTISSQTTVYGTFGMQLLDKLSIAASIPFSYNTGSNPPYCTQFTAGDNSCGAVVAIAGPAAGDIRLDGRWVAWRSADRASSLGAQLSIFFPTGSANFGGDGGVGALGMMLGETRVGPFILAGNLGVHLRPRHRINNPEPIGTGNNNKLGGLGIGDELRMAVAGYLPLADGKYRLGMALHAQTGLTFHDDEVVGNPTFFRGVNTPVEWMGEGRMKFGPADEYWVGANVGTRLSGGYGAPDFRVGGLFGTYFPIGDAFTSSPDPKAARRAQWKKESEVDTDKDGIPDNLDACPLIPEDGKTPDATDGCPTNDRDGDGIIDAKDKCPDLAEDKDGVEDTDGCPEDDFDKDGVGDAEDKCPKEPGKPNADPAKNGCPEFLIREGDQLRIFQQIHFANASSTILPDSFPILEELSAVLKANPGISLMAIEGHTDSRGQPASNKKLSQGRADSVMKWMTTHGIDSKRLEAHGYGQEKPVADNKTNEGRQKNRRCEFKILKEDSSGD